MRFKKYLLLAFALLAVGGCSDDEKVPIPADATVNLRLMVDTPNGSRTTKAVAEADLAEVSVLVFEDDGSGYTFRYLVSGYSLQTSQTADYEFLARILPSTDPVKLYLVGNAGGSLNALSSGMTETQVKEAVTMAYTPAGFTDVLPMTGEIEFTGGLTTDQNVAVSLVRSAARVDVVNTAADFTLTSVKVYRAGNLVQVIPDLLVDNAVTSPSIPAGTTRTVDTETFAVTGDEIAARIYIPESAMPAAADRRLTATTVVIGGIYGTDTAESYYRLDFVPDTDPDLFGQVLRNHLYRFEIERVLASGWDDDDQAAVNPSTQIEADIQAWDEETLYMQFDDIHYFGVSRRTVSLPYSAGTTQTVLVETNLDTYTANWSDADGNVSDPAAVIGPGGDFYDPEGVFNVAVSADGTRITVTALQLYDGSFDLPKYLLLSAGRMRILLTITQTPYVQSSRSVMLFNHAREISNFGNTVFPTAVAIGARAGGMVGILNNPDNFGPTGTIVTEGIFRAGIYDGNVNYSPYSAAFCELFDVIYLTYNNNPAVGSLIDWLGKSPNRVLVVMHDNPDNTNYTVISALLGGNYARSLTVQPYTLSPDAPDFITNGPFGTVDSSLQFRCYDDTHGYIPDNLVEANGLTPILLDANGGVAISVDIARRIVFIGDTDFYYAAAANTGIYIPNNTGDITNMASVLMANIWAWIVNTVLTESI